LPEELWALSGRDIAEDVELMPVTPFYRLNWPDGPTSIIRTTNPL
jgi:phytoene desaturase